MLVEVARRSLRKTDLYVAENRSVLRQLINQLHLIVGFGTHLTVDGDARLITRPAIGRGLPLEDEGMRVDGLSMKDVSEKLPEVLTPNESASTMSNE